MATVVFATKTTRFERSGSKHEKRIDRINVSVKIFCERFVVSRNYLYVIFVGRVESERAWHIEWPIRRRRHAFFVGHH